MEADLGRMREAAHLLVAPHPTDILHLRPFPRYQAMPDRQIQIGDDAGKGLIISLSLSAAQPWSWSRRSSQGSQQRVDRICNCSVDDVLERHDEVVCGIKVDV